MQGESLKVGGAFQTMSEVVHSTRQRHLQHRELVTINAASICDWLDTCSFPFSSCKHILRSVCQFLSDVMVVCSIKKILYRENDLLDIGLWCTKQGNKVQWDSTINSPILLQIKKSIQRQLPICMGRRVYM